jgi:hypothetical protein
MKWTNHLKKLFPHLIAVIIFLVLSYSYFSPLLEGKEIRQSDITHYKGMSKEVRDYRERTGEEALWTNRMFGGMPAFFIGTKYKNNHISNFNKLFRLGEKPASFLFLYLIGFYIALLLFRVNPWLSIIGAIAFGFSSYFFIIIAAGHNTKAIAIGYMAPIIASIFYSYRKNFWLGMALLGIFLSLQVHAKHPQITYYTAIVVVIYGLFELYNFWKSKYLVRFWRVTVFMILAVIFAIGSNMANLWTTYEYSKYSMRGQSELERMQQDATTGLDKDYATQWSYGIGETLTLLVPNYAGGSSTGSLSRDSQTYKTLINNNVPEGRANQLIKRLPLYHGDQPFTSGPVYVGALVLFLFVFSLFVVKGPIKWWLLTATIISIMLAWGDNFMILTEFFLDHVPGYNKFRTVSMTLVIAEFTIPLLAILGIKKLLNREIEKATFLKALKNSIYILGGLCLLLILAPGIFQNFAGPSDGQMPGWLSQALREDRKAILREDAFRSLIFILVGAGIIAAFFYKKLKFGYTIALLGLFILIDMWNVNKRYLNDDNFASPRKVQNPYQKSKADQVILQDPAKNFRVLNLAVNTFNDASTSYYHNSIGGYHGAKLQRYQEMIDYHIQPEMQTISQTLNKKNAGQQIDSSLAGLEVLNMLNTKYIIYNEKARPIQNPYALGNAWFVDGYRFVDNAREEINALDGFNPAQTAIIDKDFSNQIENKNFSKDTSGTITLTHYEPNHLKYQSQADSDQLVVFSEVYYPHGWKLFIDGEAAELFRTNYILRAAVVPEGDHTLEMKFEPKSYFVGNQLANYSSILLLVLLVLAIGYEIYIYIGKQTEQGDPLKKTKK